MLKESNRLLFVFVWLVPWNLSAQSKTGENWLNFEYTNAKIYHTQNSDFLVDGKINPTVTDTLSRSLSKENIKALGKTLRQKAESKYRNRNKAISVNDCFEPRHFIIFFNGRKEVIANISICFECKQLNAFPYLPGPGLNELWRYLKKLSIPVPDGYRDDVFSLPRESKREIKKLSKN